MSTQLFLLEGFAGEERDLTRAPEAIHYFGGFSPVTVPDTNWIAGWGKRPYSWESPQWAALWHDLAELCEEDSPRNHFIGSIVTMPSKSVPEGVTEFSTWREVTTVYHEGVPGHHLQVGQTVYRAELLNRRTAPIPRRARSTRRAAAATG